MSRTLQQFFISCTKYSTGPDFRNSSPTITRAQDNKMETNQDVDENDLLTIRPLLVDKPPTGRSTLIIIVYLLIR